jgi:ATP-dependent exoDNAse (exonuclease V) beta subunit
MTTSKLNNVLMERNGHDRDKNISFEEEGHKYTIHCDLESEYTSVTTWNHQFFPKFDADLIIDRMMKGRNWNLKHKYWGMTKEEIKKMWSDNAAAVSGAGTEMHYEIECFMNHPDLESYTHKDLLEEYYNEAEMCEQLVEARKSPEWRYFIKYLEENPDLKPYRTEWTVYDEDMKLSGSIDMVYENPDGTLMIYDWKRSKEISRINKFDQYAEIYCISHLPDSNFWHYSLQLNTYKVILEKKYGKKVTNLRLVRLHPNCLETNEDTYELIDVPILKKEMSDLFSLREIEVRKKEMNSDQIINETI